MFTAPSTSVSELATPKELSTPNLCFEDSDVYVAKPTDTRNRANIDIFMEYLKKVYH